jgi:ligand-binding sensor protein/sugar diacid utilization regulator
MEPTSASNALIAPDTDAPPAPDGRWQLTDLIDAETLQSIQDTFAKVFGLPTVIVDPTGRNLTNITHRVSFCEDLTRTSAVGGPRCMTCDLRAMAHAAATDRPAIFHCWNGLYDCAIPIAPKGDVLGYFLCGQIMTRPPDAERIARTAGEIGVSRDEYLDTVRGVRVMPLEQYEASIETMHTLARMIADQAAASIDNLRMLQASLTAREDATKLVEELEVILEAFRDSFAQSNEHATLDTIADQLQRLIPYDSCLIYTIDDRADELVPRIVRDPQADAFWAWRPRKGVGVLGKVAATGVRRKIDDVRDDPDFEPVPGVDLDPEAMLVVPMILKGTIFGVISLSRLERGVFTDHELRVLAVFCSHASLSLQVSRMHNENMQRLREEQALGELLSALAQSPGVEETLGAIARCGLEVLGARSAVLRCHAQSGAPSHLVRTSLDERAAAQLLAEIDPELEACLARRACRVLGRSDGSLLLVPLVGGADILGVAVFLAPAGTQWDQNLVDTFAHQSSLGLRNAVARERERQVLLQHDLLSTLGTELAEAKSRDEIRTRVLGRSAEMFGSDLSILALLDQSSDSIQVHARDGRRTRELSIRLAGRGRFASARLSGEPAPEVSVFAAWAQDLSDELARELGLVSHMAAPLRTPVGTLGGLFVAWRSAITPFSLEQQRLLGVVAAAAGASLGNVLARAETDDSLRQRFAELQALARLAEQITRLTEEGPILEELLSAIQVLAGLGGAVYAVEHDGRWEALRAPGLDPAEIAEVVDTLGRVDLAVGPARHDLGPGPRQLLVIPMRGVAAQRAAIAGPANPRDDPQRDIVLAALARFGSVALENASLHSQHRGTIAGLETANEKLRRVLLVHETLTADVIGGHGIQAVADSLAGLVAGEVAVLGSLGDVLARSPQHGDLGWRPSGEEPAAGTIVEEGDGGHIAAAPAAVEDEILAWVAARFDAPPGQVERSAIEYGALLVALELLRERTALEVEQRLRGGFLDELFSGQFVDDLMIKQGMAFGLDLAAPTRIFVIEAAEGELSPSNAHLLYSVATDSARAWPGRFLVAVEGNAAVVLLEEPAGRSESDEPGPWFEDRLEEVLRLRIPGCRFNLAVSRLVRGLREYGSAHAAARRGLDLVRLLGRSHQVVSFRQLGVQEILLQVEEPAALLEFIARYVEPLERYDHEHSSKLLASLETFYDSGFNLQEAARRLDVHVSTLRYRLTRIEELLGVDPKVGDSRLNIEVAVRAAKALAVRRD